MRRSKLFFVLLLQIIVIAIWIEPIYAYHSVLTTAQGTLDIELDILKIERDSVITEIRLAARHTPNATVSIISLAVVSSQLPVRGQFEGEDFEFNLTFYGHQGELIEFNHWNEDAGILRASQTRRLLVQEGISGFPGDQLRLILLVGTNSSIELPIARSLVPTYEITAIIEAVTIESLQTEMNIPLVQRMFDNYSVVNLIDIVISHPNNFGILAQVIRSVPFVLVGLAFLSGIAGIGGLKKGNISSRDYLTALLGLFLFVPIFTMSLGQFVPVGDSVFLKEWLVQVALEISIAFVIIVVLIVALLVFSIKLDRQRK